MFNFLNQRGLFYLISFVLSNFINSSFAEEYLWYAANATNNLYVTAEEACANYNMAQVGYPSCIYQSTELWITNDPSAGAKCLHKCGNAIQNKINAARKPMEYIVPITDDAPIPKQCSGNPIDTSRGSKIQIETRVFKTLCQKLQFNVSIQSSGKMNRQLRQRQIPILHGMRPSL